MCSCAASPSTRTSGENRACHYVIIIISVALEEDDKEAKPPIDRRSNKRQRASSQVQPAVIDLDQDRQIGIQMGELIPPNGDNAFFIHAEPMEMDEAELLPPKQPESLQQSLAGFSHLPGGVYPMDHMDAPQPTAQQGRPVLNPQNIQQFVSAMQAQQIATNARSLSIQSPLSPGGSNTPQLNTSLTMQQRFQELQQRQRQNLSRRNSVASTLPPNHALLNSLASIPENRRQQAWGAGLTANHLQQQQDRVVAASRTLAAKLNAANQPISKEAVAQQFLAAVFNAPQNGNGEVDSRVPTPIWNGEIAWSTRAGAPNEADSVKQISFAISAYPALPGNRPTFQTTEYMTNLWPPRLMITSLLPVTAADLQRIVFQYNVPYFSILPQNGQLHSTGFTVLSKMLEATQKVALVRIPNTPANKALVILWSPMQQKMVGLVFLKTSLEVIFVGLKLPNVQQEPTEQERMQHKLMEQLSHIKQQQQAMASNLSPQQIATALMLLQQRKQ
jgi:hypothetical protein